MRKFLFLTFGLFIIFFVGAAKNANAATTWTVTKTTNSNDGSCDAQDCSLREAVAAADSGDAVVFNPNLGGQTFTLGGSHLVVTKRITMTDSWRGATSSFYQAKILTGIF